jgi:hypothetical protein
MLETSDTTDTMARRIVLRPITVKYPQTSLRFLLCSCRVHVLNGGVPFQQVGGPDQNPRITKKLYKIKP